MKLTKRQLQKIIQEELEAVLAETLTKAEKEKKAKLEDELDDLEHKWMKEGKLSSALVKRLQLKESVGKVLWHSLDENGHIGEYDMQFGNTIVQRILPEHVEPVLVEEHKHAKRNDR